MAIDWDDDLLAPEPDRFRSAVRRQEWGTAAMLVRRHTLTSTESEDGDDPLADWLAEGTWESLDALTPEQIAAEWDDAFA